MKFKSNIGEIITPSLDQITMKQFTDLRKAESGAKILEILTGAVVKIDEYYICSQILPFIDYVEFYQNTTIIINTLTELPEINKLCGVKIYDDVDNYSYYKKTMVQKLIYNNKENSDLDILLPLLSIIIGEKTKKFDSELFINCYSVFIKLISKYAVIFKRDLKLCENYISYEDKIINKKANENDLQPFSEIYTMLELINLFHQTEDEIMQKPYKVIFLTLLSQHQKSKFEYKRNKVILKESKNKK
jgi:hypothetical protein